MLVFDHVTAGYGPVTVVRDVTLVVPQGSVVALLGPNGAGKTTLLRVASGLLRPSGGRVTLDQEQVSGLSPYQCASKGVCHVPEGRAVFPGLSVRENLVLFSPPEAHEERIARALEAFPLLGERLRQPAGTMSGGQQQMLALARAYVTDAKIVLLDEVSMGLAPIIVDEIFEFLPRLAQSGTSMLIVEQYVNKVLAVADYAYILTRGRLSFAGDVAELRDDDVFSRYLGIDVADEVAEPPRADAGRVGNP